MYVAKLAVGVLVCFVAVGPETMGGEPEQEVLSALPKLPKAAILAANLVRKNKWYALDDKQIASLSKALAKAPFSAPPGMRVELPPLEHKIILWTTGEHRLVPEDVVKCDDRMNFLFSTKSGRFYGLSGSIEQRELLKLIDAIKDGSEAGVRTTRRPPGRGSRPPATQGDPAQDPP